MEVDVADGAQAITSARVLARRMAKLAGTLREGIRAALAAGDDRLADALAQTIAYGLFAARCGPPGSPVAAAFPADLSEQIAGVRRDARVARTVSDLAALLDATDLGAVLGELGGATRQDPVQRFFETFLAAYDPALRGARGVYDTPEPLVAYIVASIDAILRRDLGVRDGFADAGGVQIVDPATGTGTFLRAVLALARRRFAGDAAAWARHAAEHLVPRLHGFEILMAPYAVAHVRLERELRATGCDAGAHRCLHLADGLDRLPFVVPDEGGEAPILVVLGNPPYAGHSINRSAFLEGLMGAYKRSPALGKPAQAKWLSDDYVKFIRHAEWHIQEAGRGVLGFVTSHNYLDNPTFLDMRASLLETFDVLHVLDLHGSSKKRERAQDGSKDENVFDIQQGVAVALFVRTGERRAPVVRHAELWGSRASKHAWLASHDVTTTRWTTVSPEAPRYLLVPDDASGRAAYERGWSLRDIFAPGGDPAPGIVTTHDDFAISWTREEAIGKVRALLATTSEREAREQFKLCSQGQWSYERAKRELAGGRWLSEVREILYRPFDKRWTVYDRNVAVHRRERVSRHMLSNNIALVTSRQQSQQSEAWSLVGVADGLVESCAISNKTKEINYVFPLYRYDDASTEPNISKEFLDAVEPLLYEGKARGEIAEAAFYYVYAVLHVPSYRRANRAYLRSDFPRVPLVEDPEVFERLAEFGREIARLHLLRTESKTAARFPSKGSNVVERVAFEDGAIWINGDQAFVGVAEDTWGFRMGGYRVLEKWLKDRRGRGLSFRDVQHYLHVLGAVEATVRLQAKIDEERFDDR